MNHIRANYGALLATPFLTLNVDSSGERGLLGVAFDPNFATNNFVYVYYTTAAAPIHNRVSRFTASASNPDVVAAGSEVQLLNLPSLSSATNHNGGAIHFGTDGKLYISVGDNANSANSQVLTTTLGKLLRISGTASKVPGVWTLQSVNISQYAGQTVRIRLEAGDTGSISLVEAGVDDLVITRQ